MDEIENKLYNANIELAKKQDEIDKLKLSCSKVDIDYEAEYHRLKKIELENQELKNTLVNMCKRLFNFTKEE